MDTYQVLSLLFLGGTFLIALLAYLYNRNNKPKNNASKSEKAGKAVFLC